MDRSTLSDKHWEKHSKTHHFKKQCFGNCLDARAALHTFKAGTAGWGKT